jgi:hypothetical protein
VLAQFLALGHRRSAERRVAAQMIDHVAANSHRGIGGEGVTAIFIAVRGLHQSDHPDLDQILDIDRTADAAMNVPGDLADERHVRSGEVAGVVPCRAALVGDDHIVLSGRKAHRAISRAGLAGACEPTMAMTSTGLPSGISRKDSTGVSGR